MMTSSETIAAISSAVGPASRILVRTSGPMSLALAREFTGVQELEHAAAIRAVLRSRGLSVPAWLYVFHGPRSYSGEDVVEYHIPGNPILAKMLLDELLSRGARAAEPGEFTARAFFNGRMDLTRAEGVAATIAAGSERELAAARQLLAGELARRLSPVLELLADTLALVEVGIDFVEEDVSFLSREQQRQRIAQADEALARLLADSARFERLSHEPLVALVGRPNAGKSTLLNALAGTQRSVVSHTAGTTRDVLTAEVVLPRGRVRMADLAGIEQTAGSEIERQMQAQAMRAVETADVLVLVQEIDDAGAPLSLPRDPAMVVRTKLDLASGPEGLADQVAVSALTGTGMGELRERLAEACFGKSGDGASMALNLRHVRAINDARAALARATQSASGGGAEVVAMELREALDALGSVLGRVTPDDVLGRIFSGFCIGK
jgi:tRNA modification GTPase